LGRRPLGAILHSSNELGELSQWLWHDDSTINIVVLIIIIIIIDYRDVKPCCEAWTAWGGRSLTDGLAAVAHGLMVVPR